MLYNREIRKRKKNQLSHWACTYYINDILWTFINTQYSYVYQRKSFFRCTYVKFSCTIYSTSINMHFCTFYLICCKKDDNHWLHSQDLNATICVYIATKSVTKINNKYKKYKYFIMKINFTKFYFWNNSWYFISFLYLFYISFSSHKVAIVCRLFGVL